MKTRRGFSTIDLWCAIILILVASTFVFAAAASRREIKNRIKCASNLRQIGLALKLYANENRGHFPRTIYDKNNPTPTWGTPYSADAKLGASPDGADGADPFAADDKPNTKYRPAANDVTASLYLLLRTQDITADVFVCPSSGQERWDFGGGDKHALHWTNWQGNAGIASHLSYSLTSPFLGEKAIASGLKFSDLLSSEYAMVADMNPGGAALAKLTVRSAAQDMRGGNSLNHQQEGQNVLYADAHVEFQQNPFCGQKRDNIYTFNGSEVEGRNGESAIVGPPADANDSVMLPTAADVGFKAPPPPPPDQPFDAAAATKKLAGKYVAEEAFGPRPVGATLQITDNTITLTDTALRLSYEYRVSEESDPAAGEYVLELLVDGKPHVMIGVRTEDGGVSVEVEHETPSYAGVLMGRWRAAR